MKVWALAESREKGLAAEPADAWRWLQPADAIELEFSSSPESPGAVEYPEAGELAETVTEESPEGVYCDSAGAGEDTASIAVRELLAASEMAGFEVEWIAT